MDSRVTNGTLGVVTVLLLVTMGGGGYLVHRQAQRTRSTEAAAATARSQITQLQQGLSTTQQRLTADEKQLAAAEKQLKITTSQLPPDLESLASKVTPSVVTITCGGEQGTGFALNLTPDAGFATVIVTAAHVVASCAPGASGTGGTITLVTHEEQTLTATLQAIDPERDHDVATLETKTAVPELQPASAGPTAGEFLMAVGSPLGLSDSVTQGNVSKVAELQFTHTAAISNGNSGGPLVDKHGDVVGIVDAAITPSAQTPVVENVNIAIRLITLCERALSGAECSDLH